MNSVQFRLLSKGFVRIGYIKVNNINNDEVAGVYQLFCVERWRCDKSGLSDDVRCLCGSLQWNSRTASLVQRCAHGSSPPNGTTCRLRRFSVLVGAGQRLTKDIPPAFTRWRLRAFSVVDVRLFTQLAHATLPSPNPLWCPRSDCLFEHYNRSFYLLTYFSTLAYSCFC